MALLDRLFPAWRHSDAEVRAAAVRELDRDSLDVIASVARSDGDARVRRVAIKKLDDPDLLREIAGTDSDEELRALATARAETLLMERALSDAPPEECLRALEAVTRPMHRATVAARAVHPIVRRAAVSGLTDEHALAEAARRSDDPEIGLAAIERITDGELLYRVVAGRAPSAVALAALERVQVPELLQAVTDDRQTHRKVRKRARALLESILDDDHPIRVAERRERQAQLCLAVEALSDAADPVAALAVLRDAKVEWEELSGRTAADPDVSRRFEHACESTRAAIAWVELTHAEEQRREVAHAQHLAAQERICEEVEALQGEGTPERLEAAQAAWRELADLGPHDRELSLRFVATVERCTQRYERWRARNDFRVQLEALVNDAEGLAASSDPHAAARPRAGLEQRWARLASSAAGTKWLAEERSLEQRFVEAGEALKQQAQSARAARKQRENEARNRAQGLCARLEQLAQAEKPSRAAADRALAAAANAEDHLRALPAAEREELRHRMLAARETLTRRVEENATAEEWKRWVNQDLQQRLIERAEALLAADDPKPMLKEIGRLDQEWKRCAVAPREQSQALWDRFRRARNELRRRATAYLADNLAKKEGLCAAVEQLADSTEWNTTAAAIRRMQEEWKQIGPVRQKLSAALFERFRAPANRFFERRKSFFQARKEQRDKILGEMRALCEAAEALADSSDWEATAAEIKSLQARAREVWSRGRVHARHKRDSPQQTDVLRDRFRTACDSFFERYRRRDELELEGKLAAAETIVADLEGFVPALAGPEPPTVEQIAPRLRDRLAEWSRIGPLPAQPLNALTLRLQAACDAIEAACPGGFADSEVEVESNLRQREKLCQRLERIVESLAAIEPSPDDLAERLKLALAARTIGGDAALPSEQRRREAAEAADRLKAKWQRLGPVIGGRARALARRFENTTAEIERSAFGD